MANKATLIPFKKGDPRTIAAAKKSRRGPSLVTKLKNYLRDNPDKEKALVEALVNNALDGNPAHMKMALEYVDGKVKDQMELTGKDGGPLETDGKIRIEFVNSSISKED